MDIYGNCTIAAVNFSVWMQSLQHWILLACVNGANVPMLLSS